MFKKLKDKWNVSWLQFILIFTTFALGGSLCAKVGSWFLSLLVTEKNIVYWLVYIPVMTFFWPFCVLLVSLPLGQITFFLSYLRKMGVKLGIVKTNQN